MNFSHRTYNALRRIAGPCTAYRMARAVAGVRIDTVATWAACLAITLAVGAVAAQGDTSPAQGLASEAQAIPEHAIEVTTQ